MPATPPPRGVFVPVPTFFRPSPSSSSPSPTHQPPLDLPAQSAHALALARAGITGLVLLGSTGEAIHLTASERFDLVRAVRAALDAAGFTDYPIMAGVLANGIDETLEWLADYARAGAQWGLVLAPGYFGGAVGQDGLREWYRVVAAASPVPILIYNYPGVTNNVVVSPETYVELAKHPNIVGCKMSHGNVSHHLQVSLSPQIDHTNFRVYSGFGQQLGPIVLFGADGVIDGLAAFFPKTVCRLMELSLGLASPASPSTGGESAGDDDRAKQMEEMRRFQYAVCRAEEFVGRFGVIGIREAVTRRMGLGVLGEGRLPLRGRLPEGEWERCRAELLADIERIEESL